MLEPTGRGETEGLGRGEIVGLGRGAGLIAALGKIGEDNSGALIFDLADTSVSTESVQANKRITGQKIFLSLADINFSP
ncbi:MAG: hypothetical protein AUG51_15185 [Acidobacteria bacterium 13_1_20CM_3_53_8]|nr:MAG: hypothetical protein AUG51_15185 [Acidobacteria bacterium 13_1_20CM_3_53_8]